MTMILTSLNHFSLSALKVVQEQARTNEISIYELHTKYYTGGYLYLYEIIT